MGDSAEREALVRSVREGPSWGALSRFGPWFLRGLSVEAAVLRAGGGQQQKAALVRGVREGAPTHGVHAIEMRGLWRQVQRIRAAVRADETPLGTIPPTASPPGFNHSTRKKSTRK